MVNTFNLGDLLIRHNQLHQVVEVEIDTNSRYIYTKPIDSPSSEQEWLREGQQATKLPSDITSIADAKKRYPEFFV